MNHLFKFFQIFIVFMAAAPGSASAGIWYVDNASTCTVFCGSSWGSAFNDIETAINNAAGGDEIWVKSGRYALASAINISKSISLYGGFAGTETQREQRNWQERPVIVDGRNTLTCFIISNVPGNAQIDGFMIVNGRGTGVYLGGAMNVVYSSLQVAHCTFSNNSSEHGGAIYNNYSSTAVTGCTFSGNSVADDGGAIYNWHSPAVISTSTFSGNSAGDGGAVINLYSDTIISGCTFSSNSAAEEGGAVSNWHSSPTIENCIFSANVADKGGAVSNVDYCRPKITHSTFSGNSAVRGGGLYNQNGCRPSLANCILWSNTGAQIFSVENSAPNVRYCDVQGGAVGTGNLDADPAFVDPIGPDGISRTADDSLRLKPTSPCLDAAHSDNSSATDIEGNPRYDFPGAPNTGAGTAPYHDLGAYEYQPDSDSDADGIPDDGDMSGAPGDSPCTSGETQNCDDNCPYRANPDQADQNLDGVGDTCENTTPPIFNSITANLGPDGAYVTMNNYMVFSRQSQNILWIPADPGVPCDPAEGWTCDFGVSRSYVSYREVGQAGWSPETELVWFSGTAGFYGRWKWVVPLSLVPQDGHYEFKLLAEDTAGNRGEALYQIFVDTTPPKMLYVTASLGPGGTDIPLENGMVFSRDNETINWLSYDPDAIPEQGSWPLWTLGVAHSYFSFRKTGQSGWSPEIQLTYFGGTAGFFGRWKWIYPQLLIPEDADYDIRLTTEDLGGNRTLADYQITVNTAAP